MKIEEVADFLSVSKATVRNWIKAGYLEALERNQILKESFDTLHSEILNNGKLSSRANKSLKDTHNHSDLAQIIDRMLIEMDRSPLEAGQFYESQLSDSYKNKEGIYYTPQSIVDEFFDLLDDDCSELTFCDPCCGSGNFIEGALKKGFKPENIYGFDVDQTAINLSKARVEKITNGASANLLCVNFLDEVRDLDEKFDVIFTNPPWGKKLHASEKILYSELFATGGVKDTTALFFFASLGILKENGFLGFLVQDALFNIKTFEPLRAKALSLQIIWLRDFEKPFKGLLTKAKGITLRNNSNINEDVKCVVNTSTFHRSQVEFQRNPKCIFNLSCSPEESSVIEKLLLTPHITLKNNAKYGLGIVTGNNKKYCKEKPESDYVPVYKGSDITSDGLKKPSAFIPKDLSLYQQVAPECLYLAPKKLIYKFISSKLVFYCDKDKSYVLNSANIIVLNDSFPVSHETLAKYFNTQLMNWFFQKLFETHKVLRADLESLPIFSDFLVNHPDFSEEYLLDYLGIEALQNGTFRIKK